MATSSRGLSSPGWVARQLVDRPVVLVDVGASGAPPSAWRSIAEEACYLGFDPDARARREDDAFGFQRYIMLDRAISDSDDDEATFFLTSSPYCSSMLPPNKEALAQYSFTDLFTVQETRKVPAVRLSAAVQSVGLPAIDWLKLDSQGKDLDLYLSIEAEMRSDLLAIDIEPGVIAFYDGENTFAAAHDRLIQDGFWLCDAKMQRYPRVSTTTRRRLAAHAIDYARLPGAPTALEGRYLRTLASFTSCPRALHDYARLWLLAAACNQLGFVLDVAVAAAEAHPDDGRAPALLEHSLAMVEEFLNPPPPGPASRAKHFIPERLHPIARRVLQVVRRR